MNKAMVFAAAALIAASAVAGSAQEQKKKAMELDIFGGYTAVNLSDANSALKSAVPGSTSSTDMKNGYLIGADFLFAVGNRFAIGPRVEYLGVQEGKQDNGLLQVKENLYLVPVMIGGRYTLTESGGLSLTGSVFVGWGFGYGQSKASSPLISVIETTTKFDGSAFAGEALLGAQVRLSSSVFLGLEAGYRMANIPEMDVSSTSLSTSGGGGGGLYVPSRAPVRNATGGTVNYDFSGMVLTLGLNFKF